MRWGSVSFTRSGLLAKRAGVTSVARRDVTFCRDQVSCRSLVSNPAFRRFVRVVIAAVGDLPIGGDRAGGSTSLRSFVTGIVA
ncbi:MAG TPA: hypothetical protein DCQ98_10635 [Planctomycetaceae bacterium]|nr:hypothetical protein [Planctomycetaceae bacterium]